MTAARTLAYPPNPSYGAGAGRRRIVLRKEGQQVVASLDDNYHEMSCRLHHDARSSPTSWRRRCGFPPAPAPVPLLAGFMAWAARHFSDRELEAAVVLSKTYLISNGRRYQTAAFAGHSIRINDQMIGLCHSYSTEQIDQAVFLSGSLRDYSRGIPEK